MLAADENQLVKMVADEWWWPMERLIDSEALLIRLEMLPMKEGLKTTVDETGSMPMERRSISIPS
jgi:hypothetical protein